MVALSQSYTERLNLMTEEEQKEFKELTDILRRCLFNPDRPSKPQLRLSIIRAIQKKLHNFSYEQLEEIYRELNSLDDDES